MSGVLIQRQARLNMFNCVMYIIRNNWQKQLPEWKITCNRHNTKHVLYYLIRTTVGGNNENVRINLVNMCNN